MASQTSKSAQMQANSVFHQQYLALQHTKNDYDAMQQFDAHEAAAAAVLTQAITGKFQVRVMYNGVQMELEPYLIFERHDALYVSAFNPHKNRPNDKPRELGHFRVAGLKDIQLADPFTPMAELDRTMPRAEDKLLLAID